MLPQEPPAIFERLIQRDGEGCWLWIGWRDKDGYGRARIAGRSQSVHRVAYETWIGPIAVGLEIDHLCRKPSCVNPLHLEAVTHLENIRRSPRVRRGPKQQVIPKRLITCRNGHGRTAQNCFRRAGGALVCRLCRRETDRRRWHSNAQRRATHNLSNLRQRHP